MTWWPWRRHEVHTEEAEQVLARIRQHEEEIAQLACELREAERRNHFSEMVRLAIARHRSA